MSGPASNVLPGSGTPFGGVERYAIVGERTERVPLQGLRVIETTARAVPLCNALACSVATVTDPFTTVTSAVCLTAVKRLSLFVEYISNANLASQTPAIQPSRPVIFPQFSIGQLEHGFIDFVQIETFADQIAAGPFVFVSQQSNGLGPFSLAPFTLVPALTSTTLRAVIPIDLEALGIPAGAYVRFGLVDTNTNVSFVGTCTIIATVK